MIFGQMFKIFCFVIFVVSYATVVVFADFERIDRLLRSFRNGTATPGIAAAIVEDGKAVFTQTYGLRDSTDESSHVTPNTLFQIASCSKAFTSYLIAMLVREGVVSYDDPVIKHIPEFRLSNPGVTKNIHVKDLLAHSSGLPGHDSSWYHAHMSRNDILGRLPHLAMNYGLREKYQYNNLMYSVAGIVVERLTNRSWESEIHERIFKPLNMNLSLASYGEAERLPPDVDMAKGYTTERNSSRVVFVPQEDVTMIGPAGSIYSTLNDLIKWVQFQMSSSVPKEMHVVKMANLYENRLLFDGTGENELSVFLGYGYGWAIIHHRGQYFIQHSGQSDGYCTGIGLFPEEKRGYVALGNMDAACLIFQALLKRMDDIVANRTLEKSDEEWLSELYDPSPKPKGACTEKRVDQPEQYIGRYWNPGYGYLEVSNVQSKLSILFNNLDYLLKPEKGNDFFILLPQSVANTDGGHENECSFARDSSGDVVACHVNFEPLVSPIVFTKQFREQNDVKYLESFVGTFGSGATSIRVNLNRENRLLTAIGVPQYNPENLKPIKRNWFSLNRSTLLFEFIFTNGAVSGLKVHQGTEIVYSLEKQKKMIKLEFR